ncbi:MAG: 23S rRNA (uracil(1939)-C(5))-methyltransferase RlmD [Vicinamibacterales bacterium]
MICKHFGTCGGCQLQDVPYLEQLARKTARVEDLLAPFLRDTGTRVRPMVGAPVEPGAMPWGFRHKAAFVFGPGPRARARDMVMGHYARGSKTIVPVTECPVHAPRANRIAFALRDELARAHVPAAGPVLDGILRHVLVRTTADEQAAVVMLVVTRNDKALRLPIRRFLAGPERPDGFLLNVHDRPGPFMVGRETLRLDGHASVREDRLGTPFLVSPAAFFQTNPDQAAVLVDEVTRGVFGDQPADGTLVLDLYAGSGLFAVPLAAAGATVTAVESNRQATRDAEVNARLNRLPDGRLRMVPSDVEDALGRMTRARVDAVVLDPPRAGCPPPVVDAVFGGLAPPRAVYVSCNPDALVVDLTRVLPHGYAVTRVQPVDMFPHTDHIETVVWLERS